MFDSLRRRMALSIARYLFGLEVVGADGLPDDGVILVSHRKSPFDEIFLSLALADRKLRLHEERAQPEERGRTPTDDQASGADWLGFLRAGGALGFILENPRKRAQVGKVAEFPAAGLAMDAGSRLVPVSVVGAESILPEGALFPRLSKVVVRFGKPLDVSEYIERKDSLPRDLSWEIRKLERRRTSNQ